jgi:transglutaminase-like putative cysteine protease
MLMSISHKTHYHYDGPVQHAVQALRLSPPNGMSQEVLDWSISIPGIDKAARFQDAFGNLVHLVTPPGPVTRLEIVAEGTIRTTDTAGVAGMTREAALPSLFLRQTALTKPDAAIEALAQQSLSSNRLETLHQLMGLIRDAVRYDTDATHVHTTASEALKDGAGVCQDHAHILIAGARSIGIPARYVTGYLHVDTDETAVAHHAWAEAYIDDLGWVGFDPANRICPTEHYVRLATGLDARDAAPLRGIRLGPWVENLAVEVVVKQSQQ